MHTTTTETHDEQRMDDERAEREVTMSTTLIITEYNDEFDAFTVQIDNMAIIARETDGEFVVYGNQAAEGSGEELFGPYQCDRAANLDRALTILAGFCRLNVAADAAIRATFASTTTKPKR